MVSIYPVNRRAQVEYAMTAWSCSPSSANVCPNAIHADANRGSIRDVLLKYVRASPQRFDVRYHTPTAYQLIADSGSFSTISWARMKSLACRCGRWYMQAMCSGIECSCTSTSERIRWVIMKQSVHLN